MEDMQELAVAIRKDSAAMWELREKLPELNRPKNLEGLQDLHRGILVFVGKNDQYQTTMDRLRHEQNAKRMGQGDELVRPAWEAKTGTKQFPWPFDQNLVELIKIFHHCWSPLLQDLKRDLTQVAREIEAGLVSDPSEGAIQVIRSKMGRIAIVFHWLQEHWRVPYLQQIDSSGKEHMGFQEVPPGVPRVMDEFGDQLISATNRLAVLEEKWRGDEANRIARRAQIESRVSLAIALGSLAVSILTWLLPLTR